MSQSRIDKAAAVLAGLAFCAATLLPAAAQGPKVKQAKPHVVIPKAADVKSITINAAKQVAGGPFEVKLTRENDIKTVISWLKELGWDVAKSRDAAPLKLGSLIWCHINTKNDTDFAFDLPADSIRAAGRIWALEPRKYDAFSKLARAWASDVFLNPT
jgi:hypothetical protein